MLHFVLLLISIVRFNGAVNFANNACKNYVDYSIWFFSYNCYYNPNVLADTPSMIRMNGYPVEGYTVNTMDGYILTMFRIRTNNTKRNHRPVFLMHGILTNSAVWVYSGNRSLAYNLVNEGYDVWLGTARGTIYGKGHNLYSPSSKRFWDFNLDVLAYFDVGEQLRFVANKTGKAGEIIYVGHSMGTTLAFMYASLSPSEAHRLLSGIVALAPVFYLKDSSTIESLLQIYPNLKRELERREIAGLFYGDSTHKIAVYFCRHFASACRNIMRDAYGPISTNFRPDDLLLHFANFPEGVSTQLLVHYAQIAKSGLVRQYDYGKMKNIETYQLSEPRKYDLGHIRMPVHLFYGGNDYLVPEKNVEALFKGLGSNRKVKHRVPKNPNVPAFNHIDFLLDKDIGNNLYIEMFKVMQEL